MRRDPLICQRLIIAAAEIGVAVSRMLVDLNSQSLPRRLEDGTNIRIVEASHCGGSDLRSLIIVGAAHLLQVDVSDCFWDRKDRVIAVIPRAQQPLLFPEKGHENDTAVWPRA